MPHILNPVPHILNPMPHIFERAFLFVSFPRFAHLSWWQQVSQEIPRI
jgi:hypothetical protein